MLLRIVLAISFAVAALACEPVKLPHELPGPPGCGMRDPSVSGPSTLSVAQQMTLKNQGMPHELVDNDKGGRTWVYYRQMGSVFGEKSTGEGFVFDARGLLVEQKVDVYKQTGK